MGWPFRRQSLDEMKERTSELDRALKSVGGFGAKTTTSSSSVSSAFGEVGGRSPLEREFRQEMSETFSEQDAERILIKYIEKIRHGKSGYGGQSREKAEHIVSKMWRDYLASQGVQ